MTDSVWYSHDSWRSHMPLDPQVMPIEDVRPIRGQLSLDREGNFLADAPCAVKDFLDREAAARVYLPELEEVVRQVTGAHKVVVGRGWGAPAQRPLPAVHGGRRHLPRPLRPRRLQRQLRPHGCAHDARRRPAADELLKGRFAVLNLWRALSDPPQDTPLCVCDATTVAAEDLAISRVVLGPDPEKAMRLETNMVQHNPEHRWVYYSRHEPGRAPDLPRLRLRSRAVPRVPHTAFDDPSAGRDAPPRESIDIRCVAFFD